MGGRLLLATGNEHKRRELARMLAGSGEPWQLDLLPSHVRLPPETGHSFAENAFLKARAAAQATGRPTIADDSGIEAAALDGRPGVRSARYAGEHATDEQNLQKLLREAPAGSPLRYVCAIAYVEPATGEERLFEGACTGILAADPTGDHGFGYDPAFIPDDWPGEHTMAELTDDQKDRISHRARAVHALLAWLALRPSPSDPLTAG
ncbi:MAG TPA: RdgB/HAM1 family non-canonical purine NTP pyrophosphatase [Solirubrobacteraceae bacterium]|nr:RdgB/HAM1 family non-canonical purine NTP pyrophosphatase [Solirubrobacteraceae bacterium]